jgi:predicted dinucleotide-binding enzyme
MRVGILGSGLMGGKLGTILARAGHEVVFSYSRSKAKLERLAHDGGGNARAGTPDERPLKEADAVLLAVQWSRIDDVLHQAGDLSGKVIVTCLLLMDAGNSLPILRHNRPISAPLVAQVQDVDFSLVWIASGLPTNRELAAYTPFHATPS